MPVHIGLSWISKSLLFHSWYICTGYGDSKYSMSTLLIENIRKQIKQSIWWVMIITKQTIYMQIVCNGPSSQRAGQWFQPQRGRGPRIQNNKDQKLIQETAGECLPHQNICMPSYVAGDRVFILFSPEIPEVNPQYLMVHSLSYLKSDLY